MVCHATAPVPTKKAAYYIFVFSLFSNSDLLIVKLSEHHDANLGLLSVCCSVFICKRVSVCGVRECVSIISLIYELWEFGMNYLILHY